MSEQFKEYVTSTSFALTLSRRMIDMLCQMDHYGSTWGLPGTARGLADRGLCEWMDAAAHVGEEPYIRRYRLTEAGKAVLPLLKLAGLYIEKPDWPDPVDLPPIEITIKRKEP